jgi:hypothetical protein
MTLARRKAATKAEADYQDRARELGCVVCDFRITNGLQDTWQAGGTEIHHRNLDDKHGQRQLGQHAVVALCAYHHRGVPLQGWSDEEMREVFGPSYALHARGFRAWTADVLPGMGKGTEAWQALQDELLNQSEAA